MLRLPNTKYAHFTVPHSGTRYINEAVRNAIGLKAWQCGSLKGVERLRDRNDPRASEDFIFCHVGMEPIEFINLVVQEPHIKTWITVRSPIHTWGTHWKNASVGWPNGHIQTSFDKLGQLRGQYQTLMDLAPDVGYIHRIEDPLDGLAEYLGLDLEPHEKTFSQPSPMKQAIADKDLDKIEQLCEGCPEFWTAFRDNITPDFMDFFEGMGYDIWWYNG